ncbi:hypothetical protein ACLOJK_015757 [Asimina triloba]
MGNSIEIRRKRCTPPHADTPPPICHFPWHRPSHSPSPLTLPQQFAIGVNDVTRVLERMAGTEVGSHSQEHVSISCRCKAPLVPLQAVLLASDCNPRWLTKHLPSLASSRGVPVISVRDKKGGSLRLGELVKLKTAIAIGVKARGSGINKAIEEILCERVLTKDDEQQKEVELPFPSYQTL